jgi:hypothetical protein
MHLLCSQTKLDAVSLNSSDSFCSLLMFQPAMTFDVVALSCGANGIGNSTKTGDFL